MPLPPVLAAPIARLELAPPVLWLAHGGRIDPEDIHTIVVALAPDARHLAALVNGLGSDRRGRARELHPRHGGENPAFIRLNGQVAPIYDVAAQTSWRKAAGESRLVARTDVGSVEVWTSFAGMAGTLGSPRPYETAVFGCDEPWAQDLHAAHDSLEDAKAWHARAVEVVRDHGR